MGSSIVGTPVHPITLEIKLSQEGNAFFVDLRMPSFEDHF